MRPRDFDLTSRQRRTLLKAFGASGLLAAVGRNLALAQSAPDYKALVGIYLRGGNDGENTLVRYDNAGYQNYASVRTPASGLNLAQGQLLPIQPASLATPFGFHPACGALQSLFQKKRLAVVANMGMLVQPSTRIGLTTQGGPRPANLFSHSDQQLAMESADYTGYNRVGWGGRLADKLDAFNAGQLFPPLITTAGQQTFVNGRTTIPMNVNGGANLAIENSGNGRFQFDALREAGLKEILAQGLTNTYDLAAQLLSEQGFSAASVVAPIMSNPASIVPPFFAQANSEIAGNLKSIALMLEGRAQTQLKRQIFFVNDNGYDTHDSQLGFHQSRLGDLSQGIGAFQAALAALGLEDRVTTFTFSDFGRTFKPAAGAGTDHGWGSYGFVCGGAVKGGDFYGTLPTQALGGPDDLGDDGRWIPTTSLDQYGATLARWFGIGEADLHYVFPNMGAFTSTNLGFMG